MCHVPSYAAPRCIRLSYYVTENEFAHHHHIHPSKILSDIVDVTIVERSMNHHNTLFYGTIPLLIDHESPAPLY